MKLVLYRYPIPTGTVNFRLVVQKRNIEFQIGQSHSAKLSGLPNAIGQFTLQYCVFVDNQLEIYGTEYMYPRKMNVALIPSLVPRPAPFFFFFDDWTELYS